MNLGFVVGHGDVGPLSDFEHPTLDDLMAQQQDRHGFREALLETVLNGRDPAALRAFRAVSFIPAVDAGVDRMHNGMERILQARIRPSPPSRPPSRTW